jgi:hypothetical protein
VCRLQVPVRWGAPPAQPPGGRPQRGRLHQECFVLGCGPAPRRQSFGREAAFG